MLDMEQLGRIFRAARARQGLTQAEVGEAVFGEPRYGQQRVSRIERGRVMDLKVLARVAHELDMDLGEAVSDATTIKGEEVA